MIYYQFSTRLYINNILLDCEKEINLLGTIISSDLSWSTNTNRLIKKAYARMQILRNLYTFKISLKDLILIYIIYIRCYLEQSCVVWGSSLTIEDSNSIERVQKVALRICLREDYDCYEQALTVTKLDTLEKRRKILALRFAKKSAKHPQMNQMFPLNDKKSGAVTRNSEKFYVQPTNTDRLADSAIPYMQRLLNQYSN